MKLKLKKAISESVKLKKLLNLSYNINEGINLISKLLLVVIKLYLRKQDQQQMHNI